MIQSIILAILVVVMSTMFYGYFTYSSAMILGLLTLFYLKKTSRKDALKINLWSSLVAFIVMLIAYAVLSWLSSIFFGSGATGGIEASGGLVTFWEIFDINNLLPNGAAFLVLFNIPMLIYYFFGKKDEPVIPAPIQVPVAPVVQSAGLKS